MAPPASMCFTRRRSCPPPPPPPSRTSRSTTEPAVTMSLASGAPAMAANASQLRVRLPRECRPAASTAPAAAGAACCCRLAARAAV